MVIFLTHPCVTALVLEFPDAEIFVAGKDFSRRFFPLAKVPPFRLTAPHCGASYPAIAALLGSSRLFSRGPTLLESGY